MFRNRVKLMLAICACAITSIIAGFTIYRQANPRLGVSSPLSLFDAMPNRHEFNPRKLRSSIEDNHSIPDVKVLASEAIDLLRLFCDSVDAAKFEEYASSKGMQLPETWSDPKFESFWSNCAETTQALTCGWKTSTVRPRYLSGIKQPVNGDKNEYNAITTTRHPGLPDIEAGKLDVYEIVVPGYGLRTLSGEYQEVTGGTKTTVQLAPQEFNSPMGFWFAHFDGNWYYIGVSIYNKPGNVAPPLL